MWLTIAVTFLVTILIWDYLLKRRHRRIFKISHIKGPSYTLPIFGDIRLTLENDTKNVFSLCERYCKQFGKVFHLWAFHRAILVVTDPKYFEVILGSPNHTQKSFIYNMLKCWLGDGLLISFGSKWHTRRKILTPAYHFKILEEFVEVFDRASAVLVKKLSAKADGKTAVNIFPLVCLTALDVIAETAMGVKINAQEHPDFPYVKAVKDATNIIASRIMKFHQYIDIVYMLCEFPSYLKLRKSIKVMHDFTDQVITERRTKMASSNSPEVNECTDQSNNLDVGQKKRMAFLDVLLQATIDGIPLTNHDIREEVDTFMFEGHDTTTSAISFCLYLLSQHADIQQKLFEEIIEVLGSDKDKPTTMRDLQNMKYLEAVIKESLRMYPSVPIISRHILQDTAIGDQIIPGNTTVALFIHSAGRDPDYFANPNQFNPERYYSISPDNINSFAYVPFSAGPRNCIGQKFAMLEMKSTISRVVRNFELLPLGEEVVQMMSLILRPLNGINLGLRPRDY